MIPSSAVLHHTQYTQEKATEKKTKTYSILASLFNLSENIRFHNYLSLKMTFYKETQYLEF